MLPVESSRILVISIECFKTGTSFRHCHSLKFTPGTDTTTEASACNPFRTTCRKQLYRYPKCTSLSYASGLSFRQTISAIRVSSSSPLQKMTCPKRGGFPCACSRYLVLASGKSMAKSSRPLSHVLVSGHRQQMILRPWIPTGRVPVLVNLYSTGITVPQSRCRT